MTQHPEPVDARELDDQLRRLAARVEAPAVPLADDLARGRARLARQRIVIGGACLATAGVLGLGATVAPGLGSAAGPDYAGTSASPRPPASVSTPEQGADRTKQAREKDANQLPLGIPASDDETLAAYQRVLAEYLDPGWDHLVKYTRANGNQQTGSTGDLTTSLGSKYGWTNPGESGLGMLQVSVNAGWSGTSWLCGAPSEGWSCHDVAAPGARSAEVATHEGVVEVAVEHDDGQVVILTVDGLFANNSVVGVSGMAFPEAQLVATASDERLALPGGAPDVPPVIGADTFEQVGRDVLLAAGETFEATSHAADTDAFADGRWLVGGQDRGELFWDATPLLGSAPGSSGCFDVQFDRCDHVAVAGKDVLVGYVRAKWGGGWQAIYDGPSYEVRVVFKPAYDGATFPQDRALAFVTDDRWQPSS